MAREKPPRSLLELTRTSVITQKVVKENNQVLILPAPRGPYFRANNWLVKLLFTRVTANKAGGMAALGNRDDTMVSDPSVTDGKAITETDMGPLPIRLSPLKFSYTHPHSLLKNLSH